MKVAVLLLAVGLVSGQSYFRLPQPYTYSCVESRCIRTERGDARVEAREMRSLKNCQLTCGQYGALWPQPTGDVQLSSETVNFVPDNVRITKMATSDNRIREMLQEAYRVFRRNINYIHPEYPEEYKKPLVRGEKDSFVNKFFNKQYLQKLSFGDVQNSNIGLEQGRIDQTRLGAGQLGHNQAQFDHGRTDQGRDVFEVISPFSERSERPFVARRNVDIELTVSDSSDKLTLDTDESYNLVVQTVDDKTTVTILATTYYGARHALESLSQLIAYDDTTDALSIVRDAKIQDSPKFKFRGLMLDTGRNFFPTKDIMRLLDGMSQNKMNYFHWHITDAASFPLYSNRRPEMAYYGAYSPQQVYYPEDIAEVVQYAKLRGISVIPEIDGPAHTSAGWEWGEKEGRGRLVLCTEKGQPWFSVGKEPPSGQLNPVNPELYPILGELYSDLLEYFDPEMLHMGGDDVSFKCWANANEIKEYLAANNKEANSREYFELWNTYQRNALSKLREASRGRRSQPVTPIVHSSSFAESYLDKDTYVIQINEFSNSSDIARYIQKGFRVIFANQDQWRVDCSASSWLGDKAKNCARDLPTWENFYENSPLDMLYNLGISNARSATPEGSATGISPRDSVLGGSASVWSSETSASGLEAKTWPRVSALAERLWTDPILPRSGFDHSQKRLNIQRHRMLTYGVRADPIQPEYCMHDESACYSQEKFQNIQHTTQEHANVNI